MPRPDSIRHVRRYDDADIRAIVLKQAATPSGASKSLLKDRFYTYPDRQRVGELIDDMVARGELISAHFNGGNNRGRASTRAFVSREHALAFAIGEAPTIAASTPIKRRASSSAEQAQGPKLHDKLDGMGASRGVALTVMGKPGSNARKVDATARPAPAQVRIVGNTRITVVPSRDDARYTVSELPPGYVSQLDPRAARPWAQAAAEARA